MIATKKQLAYLYGVSIPTLNKWLTNIPELRLIPNQRVFTPKQMEIIYFEIGKPDCIRQLT
jgi:hypothetical protein